MVPCLESGNVSAIVLCGNVLSAAGVAAISKLDVRSTAKHRVATANVSDERVGTLSEHGVAAACGREA